MEAKGTSSCCLPPSQLWPCGAGQVRVWFPACISNDVHTKLDIAVSDHKLRLRAERSRSAPSRVLTVNRKGRQGIYPNQTKEATLSQGVEAPFRYKAKGACCRPSLRL